MKHYLSKADKTLKDQDALNQYYEKFVSFDSLDASLILNDLFFNDVNNDNILIKDFSFNKKQKELCIWPLKSLLGMT